MLLCLAPAYADAPRDVVVSFYKEYEASQGRGPVEETGDSRGWISYLMDSQAAHVEDELKGLLLRLEASNLNSEGPVLEVDPMTDGQWALRSYTVKEPIMKDGLAYVPVFMHVGRGKGPETERLRVVLRDFGGVWRVANIVFLARDGQPAWSLLAKLKALLPPQ